MIKHKPILFLSKISGYLVQKMYIYDDLTDDNKANADRKKHIL